MNLLLLILGVLIAVAFFTVAERKVIASVQRRRGPNVVGIWGTLQAFADALKLVGKEIIVPARANLDLFILAPVITFGLSLSNWITIPAGGFYEVLADPKNSILFVLAGSSLGVYGIILSGWASNSKYAFLGSLRSAAQMISYEISLGLLIIPIAIIAGSFNFSEIVLSQKVVWYCVPLLPVTGMFFISMLAETNRTPFDLPEAEAELVAGFNVEYSSLLFALFFLGEYSNMLLLSTVISLLFFGGWLGPFMSLLPLGFWYIFKILVFAFLFIFVRATFPRYRYDQLMAIGWKIFLPLSLGYLMFVVGVLKAFDGFPIVDQIPFLNQSNLAYRFLAEQLS